MGISSERTVETVICKTNQLLLYLPRISVATFSLIDISTAPTARLKTLYLGLTKISKYPQDTSIVADARNLSILGV